MDLKNFLARRQQDGLKGYGEKLKTKSQANKVSQTPSLGPGEI